MIQLLAIVALALDMATSCWLVRREANPLLAWLLSRLRRSGAGHYIWPNWARALWLLYWIGWMVLVWFVPIAAWPCLIASGSATLWNTYCWLRRRWL